ATEIFSRHVGEKMTQEIMSGWNATDIIPIARVGRPDDIAKAILFLADRSQSEFIIGHRLIVDGGTTLTNKLLAF
ncbi:hypothetical protein PENTCL1PPCAC_17636, partial [Pristionchus entomophagus]